jgi:predicted PurR-regulated permease PerM
LFILFTQQELSGVYYHFIKKIKDYFSEGFKTFVVVVLIMVIYTFIFVKINPQMLDGFIEQNNNELAKQGNRTQKEIIENAIKIRSYYPLVMTMLAMAIYLIIGALVALAGGAFLSKKNTSATSN